MNFKAGDKVRVKSGLKKGQYYSGIFCNYEMAKMSGKVLTINDFSESYYIVKENDWFWSDEMFEPVDETEHILNAEDLAKMYAWISENCKKDFKTTTPEIIDYKYNTETGETYIKWADKTETRVRPESDTEPNQYIGFVTAYAKKAAGNTSRINSLFDKWTVKKPIKDKLAEEKRIAEETETKRILEKRKAKREKWLIRKEALRIKREYEAKKLAQEKYGVPMEFDE